jgi:hypothetical protein
VEVLLLVLVSGYTARELVTDMAAAIRGQQRPSDRKWAARQQPRQATGGARRAKPGWVRTAWENANAEAAEKAKHRHEARLAYIGQRHPAKNGRWRQRKLARAQKWDTAKDRLARRARGEAREKQAEPAGQNPDQHGQPDPPAESETTGNTGTHSSGAAPVVPPPAPGTTGRDDKTDAPGTTGRDDETDAAGHTSGGQPASNRHDESVEGSPAPVPTLPEDAAAGGGVWEADAPPPPGGRPGWRLVQPNGLAPTNRTNRTNGSNGSDERIQETGGSTMTTATQAPTGEAITIGQTRQAYQQFEQAAGDAIETAGEAAGQAANLESAADMLVSSLTDADLDEQTLAEASSLREQAGAMRQAAEQLQTAADAMSGTVKQAAAGLDQRHGLMEEAVQGTDHPAQTDYYRD